MKGYCLWLALFLIIPICFEQVESKRPGENNCPRGEIPCDGTQCIPREDWCDGENHCRNRSDEQYCRFNGYFRHSPNDCKEIHFECYDGPCIPATTKCDGFQDCRDYSDETDCEEIQTYALPIIPDYDLNAPTAAYDNETADSIRRAQQWILDQRNGCFNWGEDTSRALTALALSSDNLLFNHPEIDLMKKSLMSQLSMKYFQMWYKPPISNKGVLAIYINALVATCQDPTQFWGHNLTELLSYEHRDDEPKYPLAFLTMCITNTVNQAQLTKLENFLTKLTSTYPVNLDLQIQGYMALLCFRERGMWYDNLDRDVNRFFRKLGKEMKSDGSFGNIYTTALAAQAYMHRPAHHSLDLRMTMNFLIQQQDEDGSFGSMLATYYVLPVLKGRSLLHLRDIPCDSIPKPDDILPENGTVSFSLLINGNRPVKAKTLFINYTGNMTFFDIMQVAESMDSSYRFKYEEKVLGKMVYSISGIPNDIESGMSWTLHSQNKEMILLKNKPPATLLNVGVDRIFVKNGFAYTFLYDYY